MSSPVIFSRVPFRIPLGGGSTDLPSYYSKYGGFIFSVAINMYMDLFIKEPRTDDFIHVHYREFEAVRKVEDVKHDLAREALRTLKISNKVAISFKADTPAGTGLGSSGACAVALLKGLHLYKTGKDLPNIRVAKTVKDFFDHTLFFYTGINRYSTPILNTQSEKRVLELKHITKDIGRQIYNAFSDNDLDTFGSLMDEHWKIKKQMSGQMSNPIFDDIYKAAKEAGALGGKIMGAGGGGYFMFYCPSNDAKKRVRRTLIRTNMREMKWNLEKKGARTKVVDL